jgi:Fungal specific transcription factor domain
MATDLNLHRKSTSVSLDTAEGKARDMEVHNRERTWLLCFCLDRSHSSQMGKPNTIREEYVFFKPALLDYGTEHLVVALSGTRCSGWNHPLQVTVTLL